ncbi:DUF21 domain-containing protein [Rubritalea profundi]|uniref:Mg2+ and Co2+ transporter CorB n=1 Tax=Rubritalea profundi TaxID=1658618 RepID=A0A2S7U1E4_9BACT|nr:CNNM domain-containing protein [Rubritalea profundi]PQJ28281.1 Mg2+ and Co2+ transporter CorB [Rubritalea profundi]
MEQIWIWVGIAFCLSQSAMFSGLNLALFSLGRMGLEAEAEKGNKAAVSILNLRQDSNLLLCTILWGNVSVNVLLALLTDNILAGFGGFVLSTAGITFFGEIIPQAYFSRNALKVGAKLTPVIRFYKVFLYPLAKPCALILDGWIGPEGPSFYRERDIEIILEKHIDEDDSEISANEGRGALNFLALDDRKISEEGSVIKPSTIIKLPTKMDLPEFADFSTDKGMAFLASLKINPAKWRVITDENDVPLIVLDTPEFLARYMAYDGEVDIYRFCHRPILVKDVDETLDLVLGEFVVEADDRNDHVVDQDVVLYWTDEQKRIITGADIFGHLLRGIAQRVPMDPLDRAEESGLRPES